ncbi:MAG: hypothetical protein IKW92_10290 [Firmicutes bacterium]|nr:hypothetical protein [Bacillota bacterium]
MNAREAKDLSTQELEQLLLRRTVRRLRLPPGSITKIRIAKESLDAREKPDVYRVFSVDVLESEFAPEELLAEARRSRAKAVIASEEAVGFPEKTMLPEDAKRPVIAGFGPCGIFAALTLAKAGLKPIVLERGAAMDERVAAVERFWNEGVLDPRTNVQFGEGGAGSFSDGKLTTGTKDPVHRLILQTFVDAGADPDILYKQHPHVGTDVLRTVVVDLRKQIQALGGEVRFSTQLTGLTVEDRKLRSVEVTGPDGSSNTLEADALILALGHSARDSFAMLYEKGLQMEQKQFSMGVRIEHTQQAIDLAQLAASHEELGVGAAEYKLSVRTKAGRGVYTFCMCPGGSVVASASEEGGLCTNGMSLRARDGKNANSGLLVDVRPEDFGSSHPLAGVELQRKYERLAFEAGGSNYMAPAQRVGDFLGTENKTREPSPCPQPTYRPGVTWTDLHKCLPDFVSESLEEALPMMGRKLRGFDDPAAVMTAIEARSSSPVRIKRDARGEALASDESSIEGLYPAGEGAGYAGGIMSAAADGYHAAMHYLSRLFPSISEG